MTFAIRRFGHPSSQKTCGYRNLERVRIQPLSPTRTYAYLRAARLNYATKLVDPPASPVTELDPALTSGSPVSVAHLQSERQARSRRMLQTALGPAIAA
jgi:hypothetical protein